MKGFCDSGGGRGFDARTGLQVREEPGGTIHGQMLLLAALTLAGPRNAARMVGRTVLEQIGTMHTDLFAHYPQLRTESPQS
ncbi:MAG: hypothetical protein ACXWC4_05985 [Telluria sp.]